MRSAMRRHFAFGFVILLLFCGRANSDTNRSDTLVASATELFGAIQFDSASEELALRYLAEALTDDPANREAQQLAEAIQRRRTEREEQERQEGQQHIDQQQEQRQDEQNQSPDTNEPADDTREEEADASERDDRIEQPEEDESEEPVPSEQRSEDEMTHEEALRLLDALEAQEKTPQIRQQKQGESRGPRW